VIKMSSGRRTPAIMSSCVVTALAMIMSACDGGAVVASPTRVASSSTVVSASIGVPTVPPGPFVSYGCAATPEAAPTFDIIVTTTRTADLDSVTIRLINGSELGGPIITIPRAPLTAQFGTTRILAGTPRTFTLTPHFVCGAGRAQSVAVDISVVEPSGVVDSVTVTRPLP